LTMLSWSVEYQSTAIDFMPPSLRAEFETTPVTRYSQLGSSFFSPQWFGRTTGTIWEIATRIVLIKRPAVASNSSSLIPRTFVSGPSLPVDVGLWGHERRVGAGGTRAGAHCVVELFRTWQVTFKRCQHTSVDMGFTHNLSSSTSQLFSPYIYCSTVALCPWRRVFVDLSGILIQFSTLARYWRRVLVPGSGTDF